MPETPIAFDDVELLSEAFLGGTYRIADHTLFIGRAVPLPGTTVRVIGEVGRLVLPRWFVDQERIQGGVVCH